MNASFISAAIDDPYRLAAVRRTGLVGTDAEPVFDELSALAATLAHAPLAFMTLVDDAESHWKSCFGVAADGPRSNRVEESFCRYVVATQRELIVGDAEHDVRTRDNPSVASMGVRAWLGFPLVAPDGAVLGSFCVVDLQTHAWAPDEIAGVRTLANAASREIALRMTVREERDARERAEALVRTLQHSLLPPTLPAVPGLDVAARFHAAGAGGDLVGDFYDIVAVGERRRLFIVGDVCGKGLHAARLALFARHTVGALSLSVSEPDDVLVCLNDALAARSPSPGVFLTAICGTIERNDAGDYDVRLARGGHPPALLRRADGSVHRLLPDGPLIGIAPTIAIDEMTFTMAAGDMLVVTTDGVEESRNRTDRTMFGEPALIALVRAHGSRSAAETAEAIAAAALAHAGGIASDDIAVMVMRVPD